MRKGVLSKQFQLLLLATLLVSLINWLLFPCSESFISKAHVTNDARSRENDHTLYYKLMDKMPMFFNSSTYHKNQDSSVIFSLPKTLLIPQSQQSNQPRVDDAPPLSNTQPRLKFHLDVDKIGCPARKRALISILSTVDVHSTFRRNHLRQIYQELNSKTANTADMIDIVFYFGTPRSKEEAFLLRLEVAAHPSDSVVYGRRENKDKGKIIDMYHAMRKSRFYAPHPTHRGRFCARYQFFGKADDDAVIHLHRLSQYLEFVQETEGTMHRLWIGRTVHNFQLGMTSLLSMDLAEWVSTSRIPVLNAIGKEDKKVRDWLRSGNIDHSLVDASFRFHNKMGSRKYGPAWADGVASNASIVTHYCKSPKEFAQCVEDLFGYDFLAFRGRL
ncbi:hypothetical protein BJ741DRAFT_629099 [Chytriomyces cf. hyalinus JEL632]|nr:hypothetical protein BJ741DRAFT_629099 [Chytriomyces cf. hyalinus JEL632]